MSASNFGVFPNQVVSQDGFGPAGLGGVVNVLFNTFTHSTTGVGTSVNLFSIPNNAEIVGYTMNTTVAWDGSGTNTIDFGTTGALTQFAAALSASATGQRNNGFVATQMFTKFTAETVFTARYNGTTPTVGSTTICVFYISR